MKATGIYDFHVHIGETIGGHLLADSWKSFNRLYEHNGLEGIGVFVTESPNESLSAKLSRMRKASRSFSGKVFWHLTPRNLDMRKLEIIFKNDTDFKLYTTYRESGLYQSYESIEHFMIDMPNPKKRLLIHCEDDEIISEYSERYPFHKPSDHCLRRPEKAEIRAVDKVLNLSIKHHYPIHLVHISSPQAALLIQQAKKEADYITCETTPHYLLLNEEVLNDLEGHRWLCSPPLRSENSRGLLLELLQDGIFDIIASDHCAFPTETKDIGALYPAETPMGIAGSGVLFSLLAEQLVATGKLSMDQLFTYISINPARLMGFNIEEDKLNCERLGAPIPVVPSWANTPNPWLDFWSHYELRRHHNEV
ncbi:MAG TPA: dihydroorotase family protein [Candidatus Cloacimonas sp.]|jgi:dihydropyrimidinase|nr:dihydroorotase family protein [Candidatus Cloacimonas sp.]MDD2250553.1 dihydroorotase family protein [Candidatus Cloacimonadota bacterium]MCK9158859.1 dihydroorotase family protein [Candidatus Cloacimonas sp.]MCK9165337.1 dihydroorotase family protein [Candidatus Cloacimonas sp.]MDD3734172.1 dihydroorotase family protein [Candidatus Cloacimonadota bacterium]